MTDRMRHLPCGQAVNSNGKLSVPWICVLDLCLGAVPWGCALGLCLGAVPWGCALTGSFRRIPLLA